MCDYYFGLLKCPTNSSTKTENRIAPTFGPPIVGVSGDCGFIIPSPVCWFFSYTKSCQFCERILFMKIVFQINFRPTCSAFYQPFCFWDGFEWGTRTGSDRYMDRSFVCFTVCLFRHARIVSLTHWDRGYLIRRSELRWSSLWSLDQKVCEAFHFIGPWLIKCLEAKWQEALCDEGGK